MARSVRSFVALAALVALIALPGCKPSGSKALEPAVKPPVIQKAGVLKAGIDLEAAPYGGVDEGREAGIDVDVAAALAERLGLELEIADVKPSDAATALASGDVDVVLSVPFAQTSGAGVASAGTYVDVAPGFFSASEGTGSADATVTLDTLSVPSVAVQQGSTAYWALRSELGEKSVESYDSLRDALQAVADGKAQMAAGDALTGAYILRDLPGLAFVGQVAPSEPLAVVVAEENTSLADSVRSVLDDLAADGVLDTIRRKWAGSLPALEGVPVEETTPEP